MRFPKGISPLIAAVLLVAFTMAIAGIMAAWATQFSVGKLGPSECALSLSILEKDFSNTTVNIAFTNRNEKLNLSNIRATVIYQNLSTRSYELKNHGAADPLGALSATSASIETGSQARPKTIELVAGNCPNAPVRESF